MEWKNYLCLESSNLCYIGEHKILQIVRVLLCWMTFLKGTSFEFFKNSVKMDLFYHCAAVKAFSLKSHGRFWVDSREKRDVIMINFGTSLQQMVCHMIHFNRVHDCSMWIIQQWCMRFCKIMKNTQLKWSRCLIRTYAFLNSINVFTF